MLLTILLSMGASTLQASQPAQPSVTVFSHGLGGQGFHGGLYHTSSGQPNAFIQGPMTYFDYDDVQKPISSCLGQDADTASLHKACQPLAKADLLGVSRGAATIVTYLAKYQPQNVELVIAESPFDSVEGIVDDRTYGSGSLHHALPLIFRNYNPNGAQPITNVERIDPEIPMLLICSEQDAVVPASSTKRLYYALRKANKPKVFLLETQYGDHANIIQGQDGTMVRNVVHAFYQTHGKPHNPAWAAEGQARFASCQPSEPISWKQYLSSWWNSNWWNGSSSSSKK